MNVATSVARYDEIFTLDNRVRLVDYTVDTPGIPIFNLKHCHGKVEPGKYPTPGVPNYKQILTSSFAGLRPFVGIFWEFMKF